MGFEDAARRRMGMALRGYEGERGGMKDCLGDYCEVSRFVGRIYYVWEHRYKQALQEIFSFRLEYTSLPCLRAPSVK